MVTAKRAAREVVALRSFVLLLIKGALGVGGGRVVVVVGDGVVVISPP